MLETTATNIKTNNSPKANLENSVKQIYDDGIKNFLSAVCDIIVYDWEYKKSFKAID